MSLQLPLIDQFIRFTIRSGLRERLSSTTAILKFVQVVLGAISYSVLFKMTDETRGVFVVLAALSLPTNFIEDAVLFNLFVSTFAVLLVSFAFWLITLLMFICYIAFEETVTLLSRSFFVVLYHLLGAVCLIPMGMTMSITADRLNSPPILIISGEFTIFTGLVHGMHCFASFVEWEEETNEVEHAIGLMPRKSIIWSAIESLTKSVWFTRKSESTDPELPDD